MELTIEGVLAIQAGSNPRLIAQKLQSMLPEPASRAGEGRGLMPARRASGGVRAASAAGGRAGGAHEEEHGIRALAGHLRRHADPAARAVHRAVLDLGREHVQVHLAARPRWPPSFGDGTKGMLAGGNGLNENDGERHRPADGHAREPGRPTQGRRRRPAGRRPQHKSAILPATTRRRRRRARSTTTSGSSRRSRPRSHEHGHARCACVRASTSAGW